MAQDIRKLFKEEPKVSGHKMPKGHEARFLDKLDNELPVQPTRSLFTFLNFIKFLATVICLSYFI